MRIWYVWRRGQLRRQMPTCLPWALKTIRTNDEHPPGSCISDDDDVVMVMRNCEVQVDLEGSRCLLDPSSIQAILDPGSAAGNESKALALPPAHEVSTSAAEHKN